MIKAAGRWIVVLLLPALGLLIWLGSGRGGEDTLDRPLRTPSSRMPPPHQSHNSPAERETPSPGALSKLLDAQQPALRLAAARRLLRDPAVPAPLLLDRLDREGDTEVACQLVLAAKRAGRGQPAAPRRLADIFESSPNVELRGTVLSAFELYPDPQDAAAIARLIRKARPGQERERALALRTSHQR